MNGPSSDPLLETAVRHLSHRNFPCCRSCAVRSQSSSPLLTDTNRILAVSETLAAAETRISETLIDWYAILQVYRYSQDSHLINQQFKKLSLLLNDNNYPFSREAFDLVCEAGSVLLNPNTKTQFDNYLQSFEDETFWTVCPYCYCMYKYIEVYEDCCLKCQKCGRGFHAVSLESPPSDVVEKGEYKFLGGFPLGFDWSLRKGAENWNPFSLVRVKKGDGKRKNDSGDFIDLSVESDDLNNGVPGGDVGNCGNENDDEVAKTGEVQQDNCSGRPLMKRRKMSVPRNAKKLMGKGPRAMRMENVAQVLKDCI